MKIPERDVTYIVLSVLYLRLPTDSHWTRTSPTVPQCIKWIISKLTWFSCRYLNLNLTSQNIYSTLICGLRIFAGLLRTIYWVTSYLRLFSLFVLTYSPYMSFLYIVLNSFRTIQEVWKNSVGHRFFQPPLKKYILHLIWVLVHSYLRVRLTFLAPLTSEIQTVSPNWYPEPLLGVILEGPECYHWILRVWFPINHRSYPRLHLAPFPRYSLRYVKHRYIWLPILRLPPGGWIPWDDFRNILHGGQLMARALNGVKTLPIISTGWVGCTNVTDRRQTYGFAIANNLL